MNGENEDKGKLSRKIIANEIMKIYIDTERNKENTLQEFTREERFPSLKKH